MLFILCKHLREELSVIIVQSFIHETILSHFVFLAHQIQNIWQPRLYDFGVLLLNQIFSIQNRIIPLKRLFLVRFKNREFLFTIQNMMDIIAQIIVLIEQLNSTASWRWFLRHILIL